MVLVILSSCWFSRVELSVDMTERWCSFWNCTGVDNISAVCHDDIDEKTKQHERDLLDAGYRVQDELLDACLEDLGGGPDDDGWCGCGGCTYQACCACTGTPIEALDLVYGAADAEPWTGDTGG